MKRYLGIDPGASGGLAVRCDGYAMGYKMPETERDLSNLFAELWPGINMALIERVHSFPGQGVASSFTFGQNYGFLRGMLIAYDIPFEEVTPQRWQKALGIPPSRGKSKTEHKNILKGVAQQLFPALHITLATADSLLIAEYAMRQFGSLTEEPPPCDKPPVGKSKSRNSSRPIPR